LVGERWSLLLVGTPSSFPEDMAAENPRRVLLARGGSSFFLFFEDFFWLVSVPEEVPSFPSSKERLQNGCLEVGGR